MQANPNPPRSRLWHLYFKPTHSCPRYQVCGPSFEVQHNPDNIYANQLGGKRYIARVGCAAVTLLGPKASWAKLTTIVPAALCTTPLATATSMPDQVEP